MKWGFKMAKRAKKSNDHPLLKGLNGMAYGLFISVVFGSWLVEIGHLLTFPLFVQWGEVMVSLAGPAVALGMAYAMGAEGTILLSCLIAGALCYQENAVWLCSTYLAVITCYYVGSICKGKIPFELLLAPVVSLVIAGIVVSFLDPLMNGAVNGLIGYLNIACRFSPVWMSLFISSVMGIFSVTPLFMVGICYQMGITGLAAGAAIAGSCAGSIGLAVMSVDSNDFGKVIAIGMGTPLLQLRNVLRHPFILFILMISASLCGWVSTCLLQLAGTTYGAAWGMIGYAGPLAIVSVMGSSSWPLVMIVDLLLPAMISYSLYRLFTRLGWLNKQDLAIPDL